MAEESTSISLPAKDGSITILAHHADMMVAIVPGEMRFQTEDEQNILPLYMGRQFCADYQ